MRFFVLYRVFLIFITLSVLLALSIAVAAFYKSEPALSIERFDFQDGDLVFIRGKTWRSWLVRFMEVSGDFSHVGIVRIVNGLPHVIHATPDAEVVQLERVEDFLSPAKADRAGVYRLNENRHLAEAASREAWNTFEQKTPFDHRFDILNEDKLYCTELVWLVFKRAGVDLGKGNANFLYESKLYGKVLLPSQLTRSNVLVEMVGMF
jgi:hypothetical protein